MQGFIYLHKKRPPLASSLPSRPADNPVLQSTNSYLEDLSIDSIDHARVDGVAAVSVPQPSSCSSSYSEPAEGAARTRGLSAAKMEFLSALSEKLRALKQSSTYGETSDGAQFMTVSQDVVVTQSMIVAPSSAIQVDLRGVLVSSECHGGRNGDGGSQDDCNDSVSSRENSLSESNRSGSDSEDAYSLIAQRTLPADFATPEIVVTQKRSNFQAGVSTKETASDTVRSDAESLSSMSGPLFSSLEFQTNRTLFEEIGAKKICGTDTATRANERHERHFPTIAPSFSPSVVEDIVVQHSLPLDGTLGSMEKPPSAIRERDCVVLEPESQLPMREPGSEQDASAVPDTSVVLQSPTQSPCPTPVKPTQTSTVVETVTSLLSPVLTVAVAVAHSASASASVSASFDRIPSMANVLVPESQDASAVRPPLAGSQVAMASMEAMMMVTASVSEDSGNSNRESASSVSLPEEPGPIVHLPQSAASPSASESASDLYPLFPNNLISLESQLRRDCSSNLERQDAPECLRSGRFLIPASQELARTLVRIVEQPLKDFIPAVSDVRRTIPSSQEELEIIPASPGCSPLSPAQFLDADSNCEVPEAGGRMSNAGSNALQTSISELDPPPISKKSAKSNGQQPQKRANPESSMDSCGVPSIVKRSRVRHGKTATLPNAALFVVAEEPNLLEHPSSGLRMALSGSSTDRAETFFADRAFLIFNVSKTTKDAATALSARIQLHGGVLITALPSMEQATRYKSVHCVSLQEGLVSKTLMMLVACGFSPVLSRWIDFCHVRNEFLDPSLFAVFPTAPFHSTFIPMEDRVFYGEKVLLHPDLSSLEDWRNVIAGAGGICLFDMSVEALDEECSFFVVGEGVELPRDVRHFARSRRVHPSYIAQCILHGRVPRDLHPR
eukprot:ANDGO_06972.mRNA.1 hypothetical protein